jgi:hypothetical protein
MEVAGGIVSFIGLAGPVTQGLKFLYEFTSNARACPKDLRAIKTDINLVESLIDLVTQQCHDRNIRLRENDILARAISEAQVSLRELGDALQAFGVEDRPARFQGLKHAFKYTQTQKLVSSLHRTKTLMLEIKGLVEKFAPTTSFCVR